MTGANGDVADGGNARVPWGRPRHTRAGHIGRDRATWRAEMDGGTEVGRECGGAVAAGERLVKWP